MTRAKTEPVGTLKTIGHDEISAAIERLSSAIALRHGETPRLILLGIANGGIPLARRLAARLSVPAGTLDISFHRDDIGHQPIPKEIFATHIPADVQGATVILVDDVLHSGRTVKAALDELFDHGRPSRVELAVLVDRGGRMLPIAADYTGISLSPGPKTKVVVRLDPAHPRNDLITLTPEK